MQIMDIKTSSRLNINSPQYAGHQTTTILAINARELHIGTNLQNLEKIYNKEIVICIADRLCYGVLGNIKYRGNVGKDNEKRIYISALELFKPLNYGTTFSDLRKSLGFPPRTEKEKELIFKYSNISEYRKETEKKQEKIKQEINAISEKECDIISEAYDFIGEYIGNGLEDEILSLMLKKRINQWGIPFDCSEIDTFLKHESLREDNIVSIERLRELRSLRELRDRLASDGKLHNNITLDDSYILGLKNYFDLSRVKELPNFIAKGVNCYQIEYKKELQENIAETNVDSLLRNSSLSLVKEGKTPFLSFVKKNGIPYLKFFSFFLLKCVLHTAPKGLKVDKKLKVMCEINGKKKPICIEDFVSIAKQTLKKRTLNRLLIRSGGVVAFRELDKDGDNLKIQIFTRQDHDYVVENAEYLGCTVKKIKPKKMLKQQGSRYYPYAR